MSAETFIRMTFLPKILLAYSKPLNLPMLQKIKLDYTTLPWDCPIKLFYGRNYFRTKVSYGVCQSVTSKWSYICRQGQEWSECVWGEGGSTLAGCSLDCIYQTNLEVTDTENTLAYFITKLITSVKSFNGTGPRCRSCCRIVISQSVCHCHLLPPQSSICRQGWSLPEWSHLWDSTLMVGSQLCQQILDQGGS